MCRMLGYSGPPIALERLVTRPCHSLLRQAQHADEAKLAVNGDGFGMAWWGEDAEPGLYRDVLPAWADGNLASLCRVIRSRLFLAHVRAGTTGGTGRANCHPFTHGAWAFCHNGRIGDFAAHRRALEAALPDALYARREGATDSEVLFLTLLAEGLAEDAPGAVARVLARLAARRQGGEPDRITCLMSDGRRLLGLRHASDAHAPTLYASRGPLDHGGWALASEPLDGVAANWCAVPPESLVILDGGAPVVMPLASAPLSAVA
ncbi:class II glutamine amidotransferase [Jannaschia formosa]|uniref:class II glutamine amidotransferase n=1 Tax=Jannaschia formosa TaxID=2259592 RepID=UPI000E1BC648|nr:class II glutamine amidotransferase [Jannaschia formosa]TFL20129.1 class II glutamine amidotransferase [Jannaschia formosa]